MVKTSLIEAFDDRDVIAQIQKLDKTVRDQRGIAEGAVTAAEEARDAAQETADRFAGSVGAVVDQARQDMAQSRGDVAELRSIVTAETETVERLRLQTIALQGTVNSTRDEVQRQAGVVAETNRNAVVKTGTEIPQVISGSGGLQVAGDVSVGGDLTVSESGHIHMDASDIEVAGMAIEKSGRTTVMSNEGGISFAEDTPVTFGRPPKLGNDSTGNADRPIFLEAGVPKAMTSDVINVSNVAQTKKGSLTVGGRLSVTGPDAPGLDIIATSNAYAHVDYVNRDGGTSGLEFTPNGVRRNGTVNADAHPDTLVTKADVFTGSGSGANNLLHTIGNETASGWKNMSAVTSHVSLARQDNENYNVIARVTPSSGTYGRFPIMMCTRYLAFNGAGSVATDGTVTLRGVSIGSTGNMEIGTIASDGQVYLVWKRKGSSGQAGAVFIPAIATGTSLSETVVPADGPSQLTPTEENPFIPVVWEVVE